MKIRIAAMNVRVARIIPTKTKPVQVPNEVFHVGDT
jgi:hypothetical protein